MAGLEAFLDGTRTDDLAELSCSDPINSSEAQDSKNFFAYLGTIPEYAKTAYSRAAAYAANFLTGGKFKELEEENEKLKIKAEYDCVTGLCNRQKLESDLMKAVKEYERHGKECSLIMVDIDNFKDYNDTYGHQAGDEVLGFVGALINKQKRYEDVAGRYGGEEYLILLPNTNEAGAMTTAERLRKKIATESKKDLHEEITVSAGVASLDKMMSLASNEELASEDKAYKLLKTSDDRLYRAKERGRNQVCPYHLNQLNLVHSERLPEYSTNKTPSLAVMK